MLKYLLAGSAVLALLLAGQTYRVERLKADVRVVTEQRDAAVDELAKYRILSAQDAEAQAVVCNTRVTEARRSAIAIGKLYDRPVHVDPEGCAVRSLLSTDELRQALQPNAPSS